MELFGTAGIRGSAVERVTPELALAVGRAAGRDGAEFVVGRDGRQTGAALAAAMEAGLESAGANVLRAGQVPTPALAFATRGRRGVMLTASHNPPADNGIKVFADASEYDREAERAIEERVAADEPAVEWDRWGSSREIEVLPAYREAVVEYARGHGDSLDGLPVAVDCGNGMASLATPQVLEALGASVVALNANVDGHFPGRASKPTAETLVDFREFVADGEFALGIAHDGDADRIVIVDPEGEVVHEDTILAILAAHYTRQSDAEDPVVVTTPNASDRIDEQVEAAGGRVERVRLGSLHEGVATAREAGSEATAVVFAAEPWKHLHTAFGGWLDGIASAAVISRLVAAAGGLAPLRAPVTERPYRKANVECSDDRKETVMAGVEPELADLYPEADFETEHGVRASLPDGSWVLVRPSGTEPYVRIYAESDDVETLLSQVGDAIENLAVSTIE